MAKKKAKPQHRPAHAPPPLPFGPDPELDLPPDPRDFFPPELVSMLTEQVMRESMGVPLSPEAARAQELHFQALQAPTLEKQRRLAQQALEACPDFVDAYLLLSDLTPSRKERLQLLEQAVAAGERGIAPELLTDPKAVGRFWDHVETHAYMRARRSLGDFLWRSGRREAAVQHYRELLRLDTDDLQGVRYVLAACLLEMDQRAELAALFQRYPREQAPGWKFLKAILAFREEGDTANSRKLLKAADKASPEIITLLFEPNEFHDALTNPNSPEEEEAVGFLQASQGTIRNIPGVLDWILRIINKGSGGKKRKEPKATGPLPAVKQALAALPVKAEEAWDADARRLPTWVEGGAGFIRPWMMLVGNRTHGQVLGQGMFTQTPTAEHLWDVLAQAMQKPLAGKPHRPGLIQLRQHAMFATLPPHLEELGIRVRQVDHLDFDDALFADLFQSLEGMDDRPGLLTIPGIRPEHLERFFAAAAEYYRRAPWTMLDADNAVKIASNRFKGGPWYGMIMGQMGMADGLALYDDLKMLRVTTAPGKSPEDHALKTRAVSLLYGEVMQMPCADHDALETHGWPVAGPAAYPWLLRKEKGMKIVLPSKEEVELMTACLAAIPPFVATHNLDEEATETVDIPVSEGTANLTLSWQHLG